MRATALISVVISLAWASACAKSRERGSDDARDDTRAEALASGEPSAEAVPAAPPPSQPGPNLSRRVRSSWNPTTPSMLVTRIVGLARFEGQWWTVYDATRVGGSHERAIRQISEHTLGTGIALPKDARSLTALISGEDGQAPLLLYKAPTAGEAAREHDFHAARMREQTGQRVLTVTGRPRGSLQTGRTAWVAASPPRGIVLFSDPVHGAPVTIGSVTMGKRTIVERRPRLLSENPGYVVAAGGTWKRHAIAEKPRPAAVAASRDALVVITLESARDGSSTLGASWLDDSGRITQRSKQKLASPDAFREVASALIDAQGALRVAGVRSGYPSSEYATIVAGFDRRGKALSPVRLAASAAITKTDVSLLACGDSLWVVEHSASSRESHAFRALRLTAGEPESHLLWQKSFERPTWLGGSPIWTACDGERAAFAASFRRDRQPGSIAFAEWDAE